MMMRCQTNMEAIMLLLFLLSFSPATWALQHWLSQPSYQEVNPEGTAIISCIIGSKKGDCRWEKDGQPIGIYADKYEWASNEENDCSLKVSNASLNYDDGSWQCQVTASNFSAKDALISEGALLVVRQKPSEIFILNEQNVENELEASSLVTAGSAGSSVRLQCLVRGANPPAKLHWTLDNQPVLNGHDQVDEREIGNSGRTWTSKSTLLLPVTRVDDGAVVSCRASHPANLEQELVNRTTLNIRYAPVVRIETSNLDQLEQDRDEALLQCKVESNPEGRVRWFKEGIDEVFSTDKDIHFRPVTRHSAGIYYCIAENELGRSQRARIELKVLYPPSILSVGPSSLVRVSRLSRAELSCEADGNPEPSYQWLQQLSNQQVLIRGDTKRLVLDQINYEHQGQFVCKALNKIKGENRIVQSEPIQIEVSGAPQILQNNNIRRNEVKVMNGEDARLEVEFCARPLPALTWHIGHMMDDGPGMSEDGLGNVDFGSKLVLASGTSHGRFVAEGARATERSDCYRSALLILGAHVDDAREYRIDMVNQHGRESHVITLRVRDVVTQESLIAVMVGAVLTLLLLLLLCLYCCRSRSADNNANHRSARKEHKSADIESEKTDVVSACSLASVTDKLAAIPPDAFYVSGDTIDDNDSNANNGNSNESFSIPLGLNKGLYVNSCAAPASSSSSCTTDSLPARIVYTELCFPKISNYGSMRKKPRHVGVSCTIERRRF